MKKLPVVMFLGALACAQAPTWAAEAASSLPFRYKVRSDWVYAKYGKDVYDCWNDGVAARCGRTPGQLEGETEARAMYDRELSDTLELRVQVGAEGYYNGGWTERSARASGAASGRPRWLAHLVDTWVGLHHEDLGTLRVGSGLNPYQQPSGQMDGNTDLGAKELLERMVAYDSPLLLGDRATGLSLSAAVYDGARYRKARYEQAPEDSSRAARARGVSLMLDGKIRGNISAKLALYSERYGARKYYGTGPLDGIYTVVPGSGAATAQYNEDNPALTTYAGSGAKARSRGVAVELGYEGAAFKVGGQLSHNQRLRVDTLSAPGFAQDGYGTGYKSNGTALYFSTWTGPWSLWTKAYVLRFKLSDPQGLNTSSDWIYANSTYTSTRVSAELGYAINTHVKAVIGTEWLKRDFKESPLAGGSCATGRVHACYDPQGYRVMAGVRTNF